MKMRAFIDHNIKQATRIGGGRGYFLVYPLGIYFDENILSIPPGNFGHSRCLI